MAFTGSSEVRSGHIPGAAQIDWTDLGLADTSDPSITHWQADIDEVKTVLDDPNVVLVDARTPAEYVKRHIPGAINIPLIDNAVATAPKVWKSREDLRAMYEAAGVTPDKTVIPYCSTGVRSAATYFALALLGYPHVSLYTGPWDESNKHPELRTSIGQKP